MSKKYISIIISLILCVALSVSVFAVNTEEAKQILRNKGLTDDNIKTLCHLSITPEEASEMSIAQLKSLLGNYFGISYSTQARAAANTLISVTNVPDDMYGTGTAQFTTWSGFSAGSFSGQSLGNYILSQVDTFAKSVYGTSAKKTQKYYYLYGEYDAALANDPGPYHKGIDLKCSTSGVRINTAHSGTLVQNTDYGAACIQATYGSSKRTYIYAHMDELKPAGYYSCGQQIGKQGKVNAKGEHLHFEVRTAYKDKLAKPSEYSQTETTSPYSAMTIEISARSLTKK